MQHRAGNMSEELIHCVKLTLAYLYIRNQTQEGIQSKPACL